MMLLKHHASLRQPNLMTFATAMLNPTYKLYSGYRDAIIAAFNYRFDYSFIVFHLKRFEVTLAITLLLKSNPRQQDATKISYIQYNYKVHSCFVLYCSTFKRY